MAGTNTFTNRATWYESGTTHISNWQVTNGRVCSFTTNDATTCAECPCLADAIWRVSHKNAREYFIMDQFLQGLTDVETRWHITLAHPFGVDQAVSLATEYENLTQSVRAPQTHKPKQVPAVQEASTSNAEKFLQTMVDLMTQRSPNVKPRPPRPPRPLKPKLCFGCD